MNLKKSFSIYLFSTLLERAIGFLIIPILTRLLLPESLGKLSLITSTTAFITPFILLSTSGAIYVEYFKTDNKKTFASYFSTGLLINFLFFVCFFSLMFSFKSFLAKTIGCPEEWIILIPIFSLFESVKSTMLSLFQIEQKPQSYTIFSFAYTVFNFAISLILVYSFKLDYAGRLWGIFISGLIMLVLAIFIFQKKKLLTSQFSKLSFKDIITYGFPLLPHSLGLLVLDIADRYFLNHYSGERVLGIYSVGYLFGSVVYMLANAFSAAWTPVLYTELKKDNHIADLKIVKISFYFIFGIIISSVAYCIFLPTIYRLLVSELYYESLKYVNFIVLGYIFMAVYLVFAGIIFYEKKNKIFGYVALINVTANIYMNFVLIKYFGAMGAALATCISMFIFMLVVMYYSNKIKALPWREGFKEFIGSIKQTLNDRLRKK